MRPPRVFYLVGVEKTKGVDKIGVNQVCNSLSFLVCKTGGVVISVRAGDVELGVSGIKIAASNDGFNLLEFFEIIQKFGVPLCLAKFETLEVAFGIWCVNIDQEKIFKLDSEDSPFVQWVAKLVGKIFSITEVREDIEWF